MSAGHDAEGAPDASEMLFDPERLRRRWQHTGGEPQHAPPLPPALVGVVPAGDPVRAARVTLRALERHCEARFRAQWPALGPFFGEVWRHLGRGGEAEPSASPPDAEALAEADRALESLEELLEVFAFHAPAAPSAPGPRPDVGKR